VKRTLAIAGSASTGLVTDRVRAPTMFVATTGLKLLSTVALLVMLNSASTAVRAPEVLSV
jgi:hypothetical protein